MTHEPSVEAVGICGEELGFAFRDDMEFGEMARAVLRCAVEKCGYKTPGECEAIELISRNNHNLAKHCQQKVERAEATERRLLDEKIHWMNQLRERDEYKELAKIADAALFECRENCGRCLAQKQKAVDHYAEVSRQMAHERDELQRQLDAREST